MRKTSGLALGTAIVLGMNNALGSLLLLVLFHGEQLISRTGLTLITGVALMVAGVALCSWAGSIKKEVSAEEAGNLSSTDSKMRVRKGVLLAILSGAFGTMFNFAVVYGDRLRSPAERAGARPVNTNNVVWCVSLMGGFIVNSAYCGYLLTRNRNWSLFTARTSVRNSILSIVMRGTWKGGVAIYGMTVSKLERFGPSIGWALIQRTAIMARNAMGLITGDRRNTTNRFRCRMISGLLTLFGGIATVALSALG